MNERTKAALIGGAAVGVLSLIPFLNYCCCLWAIGGGMLAVYLYTQKSTGPVQPGDGAMLGAMAGGFGALIFLLINVPLSLIIGAAAMEQAFRQANIDLPLGGVALMLFGSVIGAVVLAGLTTLGGLIGAAAFGKNRPGGMPPPPPPINYGGTPPSDFSGTTPGNFGGTPPPPAGGGFGTGS